MPQTHCITHRVVSLTDAWQPFVITLDALGIYWVQLGLGKPHAQVRTPAAKIGIVLFVVDHVYNIGLTLVKLSVLLFYVRVLGKNKVHRIRFWIVGFLLLGWFVGITLVVFLTCTPLEKLWDDSIPGRCLSVQSTFIGAAVANILMDVILLMLPMPIVWRLQMKTTRKIVLTGVFVAGYRYACYFSQSILR